MALQVLLAAFAFLALLVYIAVWYARATRRPKNFPPGPDWLPVIGNLPILKKLAREAGGQHEAIRHLSEAYNSDVVGIRLGGNLAICVVGYRLVHHVLTHDDFEGRPDDFFIRLRCMGERRGITCVDGPFWNEQRTFVTRHLRSLGFGKKRMEKMVMDELAQILQHLDDTTTKNIEIEPLFAPSVLNVLWTLTTGNRFDRDDPHLEEFLQILYTRSKAFDMAGGTLNQMPWLRHIAPEWVGYSMIERLNENLKNFFKQTIQEHFDTWYSGRQDDLIYSFITEMKEGNSATFTYDQLIIICLDIFMGGATTISTAMDFIFLAMLLNPDAQEKAAQMINSTISPDEPVKYSDRLKMPYIEALIMETERRFSIIPILAPKRVFKDTVLDGYDIPKNTTVLVNVHTVHFDKEYWRDPDVFRPERFLDGDGRVLPGDRVLNFGLGRRRCLGELLARQCIFLFFVTILRKYKISPVPGSPAPSSKPIPGITLSPQKYKLNFELRQ